MQKNSIFPRQTVRRAVPLILTVAWIVFIFANSMQSGEESGEQSRSALAWLLGLFSSLGLPISISELFLRKLAHFSEYALLGLLFSFDLWGFDLLAKSKKISSLFLCSLTAIPCSTLCAAIDEFVVQRLTPGRGPSIVDVLIDTAGATCAVLIFFFVLWLLRKRVTPRKNQEKPCNNPNFMI